jgi:hypothetical protein
MRDGWMADVAAPLLDLNRAKDSHPLIFAWHILPVG